MPAETTPRMPPPSIASATRAPSPCGATLPRAARARRMSTRLGAVTAGAGVSLASRENAFRQPDVDPDVRQVDDLRDGDVARDADELIRLHLRQTARLDEKVDHLLNGGRHRDLEVGIGGHRDVIGR